MGRSYYPIVVSSNLKKKHLSRLFLRYISQNMELMYQNSFLRYNVEIKENIFDKKLPLHNQTHEEMQKYMFIFLLSDFCTNRKYSLLLFLSIKLELKCLFIFEIVKPRRFFCGLTPHSHIFVKFTCKIFMTMF